MTSAYGALASGAFIEQRESNRLDGGCHHYNVYETADGEHISIGSNEPQFYRRMLDMLGLGEAELPEQTDRSSWPAMRTRLAAIFKTRTREQWTEILEQADVCYAPVLRMSEALEHPHNVARGSFVELDGVAQPGPAPKFDRTPGSVGMGCAYAGEHSRQVLAEWGFDNDTIAALEDSGAVRQR
jgi:alpha-methylacyl-CoA racemase